MRVFWNWQLSTQWFSHIYHQRNFSSNNMRLKNGLYKVKVYTKPWYSGDERFRRRRIPTDDVEQRPRKPRHGFSFTCSWITPTLKFGILSHEGTPKRKQFKSIKQFSEHKFQSTSSGHELRITCDPRVPAEKINADSKFATFHGTRVCKIVVYYNSQKCAWEIAGEFILGVQTEPACIVMFEHLRVTHIFSVTRLLALIRNRESRTYVKSGFQGWQGGL